MTVHKQISVSAGIRGTQILLAPQDYLQVVEATVGLISRPTAQQT